MGTAQSFISPEAVATVIVVGVTAGIGYKQLASPDNTELSSTPSDSAVVGGKKGKGKKKAKTSSGVSTPIAEGAKTPQNVVPFPAVIPGRFDDGALDSSADSGVEGTAPSSKAKKGKKKKAGKAQSKDTSPGGDAPVEVVATTNPSPSIVETSPPKSSIKSKKRKQQNPSADSHAQLQQSTASLASLATESDGDWTRVSRRADKPRTSSATGALSDVGQTTSITTGTSSPVETRTEEEEEEEEGTGTGERHPLAKKLLSKPRKTGVEDMLATSDYSSYSRVMRVLPGDKPAAGFSWGDYEDVIAESGELDGDGGTEADGEDDGWGVVKRGGRPRKTTSSQQNVLTGQVASAPETLTKRQRQNAVKREVQKSAKEEAERERLATLARYRRESERAKIEAQYAKGGSKKATSGGMTAAVDEKGKLVWD